MAEKKAAPKQLELKVSVDLKDFKEDQLNLAAYVFNRSGRLLIKQPVIVKKGKVATEIKIPESPQWLIVKLGPDVDDLKKLSHFKPITKKVEIIPEKKPEVIYELLKPAYIFWWWTSYIVTGTVRKEDLPVCTGTVDIFDVDIKHCFWLLPYEILERVRDAIIDVIVDPPRADLPDLTQWPPRNEDDECGSVPKGPIVGPPRILTDEQITCKLTRISPKYDFVGQRLSGLSTVRERLNKQLTTLPLPERRAFLDREPVEGVKLEKLVYCSTKQFTELLVGKVQLFRFWLCFPWIYWIWWPWCISSLTKIGEADLQPDGSFYKEIKIPFWEDDIPDLWFSVRQEIAGIERIIYERHPVICNTYWNHPSGDPVHLKVTDPEAMACFDTPPVDHPGMFVMPLSIGNDGWYDIHQAHLKPGDLPDDDKGLFQRTDPYGTMLDIQMQFHDQLRSHNIRYYRWSYKKNSASVWFPIRTHIAHRHLVINLGNVFLKSESLGPVSKGAESNLFEIPDPNLLWVIINRNDRRFAAWDTTGLSDGKYELRLEMFDNNGLKIGDPIAKGFTYFLPTSNLVGGVWPVDTHPFIQSDGSVLLNVHIDNQDTVSDIKKVGMAGGGFTGECQFLEFTDSDDNVRIDYLAYHPNNFMATYSLNIKRGKSGYPIASSSGNTIPALPPSGDYKEFKVADLLGVYPRCSFAVELHTKPRTRDGYSRIRQYESHDTAAFTLIPASATPPL